MICTKCHSQYKSSSHKVGESNLVYGLCENCGTRLKYKFVLDGFNKGLFISSAAYVIFLLILYERGSFKRLLVVLLLVIIPASVFMLLGTWVGRQGVNYYETTKEYEHCKFLQNLIGAVLGFVTLIIIYFFVYNLTM